MTAQVIEWNGVRKRFWKNNIPSPALDDISLSVRRGEFFAIVGPSGCGKSTLLNMTAGLMQPSGGTVAYDGRFVEGVNTSVGYITQKDSLMPWLTVEKNVGLALEIRGASAGDRKTEIARAIEAVGLTGFERHFPHELSGGMRKRASMARTLIYDPETLLMDEPFGALDAQLKLVMQAELLRIWSATTKTVVFVTHDLEEAVALADRVAVISSRPGRLKAVIDIDLPRPRDVFSIRFDPQFGRYVESLWEILRGDLTEEAAR